MDRVVYISPDTREALLAYVKQRLASYVKRLFLVEKGPHKGSPISVRGIHQKRMEYYARKAGMAASCHHLRHTMVTQMSNANADRVSIQDLLGRSRIKTTQRYCNISNLKAHRDYFKAMRVILQRTGANPL
jgi:site-specific recombinase XerD